MPEVWLNYDKLYLYTTTSNSGGERQGNVCTDNRTYIHMDLIGHTGRPLVIETAHPIILVFSHIIIKSDF